MDDIYLFKVDEEQFEKILAGTKTAHLFINDRQHKILAVGNEIKFVCESENGKKEVCAVVESVLNFNTETEAVEAIGKEKCGYKNRETFDKVADQFLANNDSYEKIEKNGIGVLIFKIK